MNNDRRKRILEVIDKLEQELEKLEFVREEEIEAHDNLPESLQESDRGEAMQEAIDAMEEAYEYIRDAVDRLEDAQI